jgi:hypothetical protein
LKKAEELEVQVMETRKRTLGQEHPSTLSSMNNLALTLCKQRRWMESEVLEVLEVQTMETRKMVLGQEYPLTLTSIANLALKNRNRGQWKEAEELLMQMMETETGYLAKSIQIP